MKKNLGCNLWRLVCFQVQFATSMLSNVETFINGNKMISNGPNLQIWYYFCFLLFKPHLVQDQFLTDLMVATPFSLDSLSMLLRSLIMNV